MIDRFTKIVLTIIAVSTSAIALQGLRPTPAVAQFGENGCGTFRNPCYIDYGGIGGLAVTIKPY